MKIHLLVCPEKGKKPDYSLPMEVPSVPAPGDYLSVLRQDPSTKEPLTDGNGQLMLETFVVIRRRFVCNFPDNGEPFRDGNDPVKGTTEDIGVEVRPASSYFSPDRFKSQLGPDSESWEWG